MLPADGEVRRVADALTGRIMAGVYSPGLRLPAEVDLAEEFACGRSTIREALRHLSGLGVVRSRRGSGAVVLDYRSHGCSMSLLVPWLAAGGFDQPIDVVARELLHIRTHVACEGARLAARYAPPGALADARGVIDRSPDFESDPAAHALNDLEFHWALNVASDFSPAVWLANALREPLSELMRWFPPLMLVPNNYVPNMRALLALVESRQADAAVALLTEHLAEVDAAVFSAVSGGAP